MKNEQNILNTLLEITRISNAPRMDFQTRLNRIVQAISKCMNAERASIMLRKGRNRLEVAASTIPSLTGCRTNLDSDSPSAWVVKNKQVLYVKDSSNKGRPSNRFKDYRKQAFLIAPIMTGQRINGVISITEKMIGPDCYSPEEQEGFVLIAGFILSALENHRLAESLRKSKQRLHKKNQELKRLEQLRTELFNMLIHDLKGPISEVIANLDILTYTVQDSENLDYVNAAQTASDTLYRMVADLLDIARLEEGNLPLVYEQFSPVDLIEESLSRIHGLAKIKNIHLVRARHDNGDIGMIQADRELLMRVLQNLLMNAIDHSNSGESVEVGCVPQDNRHIEIYVSDNGPGIPEQYKEAIFEKFNQIGKKQDGRTYTTGLGLTFCKLAVEAHKGNIFVDSDGRKGSCFRFTICTHG